MRLTIKKLLFALSIIIVQQGLSIAQNQTQSVFVLVDLSMNLKVDKRKISSSMRQDAINLTKSIINATYNKADYPNWKTTGVFVAPEINKILKGKGKALIGVDDFLMIMPFGKRSTTNNFRITPITRYPNDFNNNFNFPFTYYEGDTWGNYALAKACKIASDNKIPNYYVFRIQGHADDPNSDPYLTQAELDMIDAYETGADNKSKTKLSHKDARFTITIQEFDITKFPGISKVKKIVISPKNVTKKSLRIISPKGDIKKPIEFESPNIRISWISMGLNEDSTINYTIAVNNLNTKKTKSHKVKNLNSKSLELEPGKYKLSVSTKGLRSKSQYFIIKKERGGGFGFFILLLILGTGAYFGYKYFMGQKGKTKSNNWTDDKAESDTTAQENTDNDDDWN